MITRDVLTTLRPGPHMFCYCPDCGARFSTDASDWYQWDAHDPLECQHCELPVVLATERVIIDVVAE